MDVGQFDQIATKLPTSHVTIRPSLKPLIPAKMSTPKIPSLAPGGGGAARDARAALIEGSGASFPSLGPLMKSDTTLGFSWTNLAITGFPRSATRSPVLLAMLNCSTISGCSLTSFCTAGFFKKEDRSMPLGLLVGASWFRGLGTGLPVCGFLVVGAFAAFASPSKSRYSSSSSYSKPSTSKSSPAKHSRLVCLI